MWYAVYRTDTNRLVSFGSVISAPLRSGLSSKKFTVKPADGFVWHEATLDFVSPPAPRIVPKLVFIQRFTEAEQVNLFGYQFDNVLTTARKKRIRAFISFLNFLDKVDLDMGTIQSGVNYLETAGIIATGRATEILN